MFQLDGVLFLNDLSSLSSTCPILTMVCCCCCCCSLSGQMHPVVPSGAVPEEYLRALRPFATSDDLRLSSLQLSLDPAAAAHAAAAAAYYHPAYLHHPLSLPRYLSTF